MKNKTGLMVFRLAAVLATFLAAILATHFLPARAASDADLSAAFREPPLEFRPYTRWWWPGNDVDGQELRREIDLLADHFFGGVEVQPFVMGLNAKASPEELARRYSFDEPSYYDNLAAVMDEAEKRGLKVDLTLGTGWPSGGPNLKPEQTMQTLLWNERVVTGPGPVSLAVPAPQKPLFYTAAELIEGAMGPVADWLGDQARLEAVVAARVTGGRRSLNPINLADSLELAPGSVQVITDKVKGGKLRWSAPAGRWAIIFIFSAPDGEHPTLSAQRDPGYVVDHLDRQAFTAHLDHLLGPRTGLPPFAGRSFRAFFNDSFEFKTERHFSKNFVAEFSRRRGYDVSPWLPALLAPGADNFFLQIAGLRRAAPFRLSADDERVRHDYSLTVSDLFIENFVDGANQWAEAHGVLSRAQAYGMDIDVIRASGRVHLPETEALYSGGSEMFLKLASSGAHLYGRNLVACESLVWAGRDYLTTPVKAKAALDKLFTSGVNFVIYHGYSYRKTNGYGETGWFPWSSPYQSSHFSTNLSEGNSFWPYWPAINRYVARCQYLLRQGKPRTDLAVYYPWLGVPSSFSVNTDHHEFLFNGFFPGEPPLTGNGMLDSVRSALDTGVPDPRSAWLARVWPALQKLEDHGYTWEWVNDEKLAGAKKAPGGIAMGEGVYRAVVVIDAPSMEPAAATRLAGLAREGAPVVVIGDAPKQQPGFFQKETGDAAVAAAFASLPTSRDGDDAAVRLASAGVRPETQFTDVSPARSIARQLPGGGRVFFFRNPTAENLTLKFSVDSGCGNARWLDAWTGEEFAAADEGGNFRAELAPYGSIFLACNVAGLGAAPARAWPGSTAVAREIPLGPWTLAVSGEDVAGGSFNRKLDRLADWREIPELRYCSSPGVYATEFDLVPAAGRVMLELGGVNGMAEVAVNGKDVGVAMLPPFQVDLSGLVAPGGNHVTVRVIPSQMNRFIGKAKKGDPEYAQFKGQEASLLPAGMTGPARVLLLGD